MNPINIEATPVNISHKGGIFKKYPSDFLREDIALLEEYDIEFYSQDRKAYRIQNGTLYHSLFTCPITLLLEHAINTNNIICINKLLNTLNIPTHSSEHKPLTIKERIGYFYLNEQG